MKLKILLGLGLTLIITSCGVTNNVITRSPKVVLKQPKPKPDHKMVQDKKIGGNTSTIQPKNTEEYIKRFAPIAVQKMKEFKIPASITLAQGILESGSGRSNLAIRSNNHFGIKCHKGWEGSSVTHDDDAVGECFRKYIHPETSYEDHSKFLTSRSRYAKLFKLSHTDHKGWAYGLKRAGYATDPKYPQKLLKLINKYDLHKYDLGLSPKTKTKTIVNKVNTKTHKVSKGDTLYSIAKKYNVSVWAIKKWNNLKDNHLKIDQTLILK